MGLKDFMIGIVKGIFFENPARKYTLDEHIARLQEGGEQISQKITATTDSPKNREQLLHLIGIERWGQRRLKTLLGEPMLNDEYDGYRPSAESEWSGLCQSFAETRADTVSLAQKLKEKNVPATEPVPHNTFGNLTLRGWLQYLNTHAQREVGSIR